MKSSEIRQKFLDFFAAKGHTIVASSPLVPGNDPTLMFTNSGMVQFKDVFLGTDKRSYVRAASVQACLRAGGKHNDLENVGYTARHHTFFEMLGNWSFGDYFKRESLKWAWELLTEVYKLPADKLWATVYVDDDEAYDIWTKEIGLPKERVVRIGDNKGGKYMSDNFWMMADTGPCGPCSEIFYDHGPGIPGGPPGSPDADGDRYIEIWNNVFMQFDMQEDGSVKPLPAPCVDTGMGLERLAAILQHVHSNYEIDLFQELIKAAARETGCKDLDNKSLRVIADHIRATAFLVSDGVIPGNEGRGYVQRRIVRRAIRHGYKLGQKTPFFHKLVPDLVRLMGAAYPNLAANERRIVEVLKAEEERFFATIENGMGILDGRIERSIAELAGASDGVRGLEPHPSKGITGISHWIGRIENVQMDIFIANEIPFGDALTFIQAREQKQRKLLWKVVKDNEKQEEDELAKQWIERLSRERRIPENFVYDIISYSNLVDRLRLRPPLDGEFAFLLHDTYGFPLDLTADICREYGIAVDDQGFNAAMEKQKSQARAAGKFKMDKLLEYSGAGNTFVGYEKLEAQAKIVALYVDGTQSAQLKAGQHGVVVLDTTPFYAESGGQVGDEGMLVSGSARFEVGDTQKIKADVYGHHGLLAQGTLNVGDHVVAQVDLHKRAATMRNHSVTHLMHKALREVLGSHVQQKGSQVDPDKTRFDFVHNQPVTAAEIQRVEAIVNAEILANAATQARVMAIEDAQKTGAMMLFGEKYGDTVRVLDIGFSRELCGGTHVQRTGDIGLFKIVAESGVAAGVRRIEAVTGEGALALVQQQEHQLRQVADAVKSQPAEAALRIAQILDNVKALEKELLALKSKFASTQGDELANQAQDIGGVKVLAAQLDGADAAALRETMDKLKDKLGSAAIVLAAVADGKVSLIAGVTQDATAKVKAGELVNFVAQQVGGKGGGRPDMAMAGGTQPENLPAALASVPGWLQGRL